MQRYLAWTRGRQDPDMRRSRSGALALTIILHILVFAILLFQKSEPIVKLEQSGLTTFMLPKANEGTSKAKTEEHKEQRKAAATAKHDEDEQQQQAPTPQVKPPPPVPTPPNDLQMPFLQLSSEDYQSSNIGKMASQRHASGDSAAADSKATYGPGEGPGGVTLYPADWYREPTETELSGYLPADSPRSGGWGMIACKTVARYHVDDCYILGESPRGSGFGRAVLNAAWQFLVLPPRRNGQPMVGSWVSIRITYTPSGRISIGG